VAWWSIALITPSREGARSIPNPGTPFPTLGIGCFTPLPGSGWQVLSDSQHGLNGSEKSDTLQKMVAGQPEPDPQKKKIIEAGFLISDYKCSCPKKGLALMLHPHKNLNFFYGFPA
jgi:hypothetical protein